MLTHMHISTHIFKGIVVVFKFGDRLQDFNPIVTPGVRRPRESQKPSYY